ncbi:hypothetical protein [Burkholderia pseudomallei]|uniref:hypothetical protein n=1 Tax=Burkholderia pseudomallei TaxID=28450 RepID=UPI0009D09C65|nr:hypothetical protein [Burkholderia pseudomallei]ONC90797.1 hypothetical protein AQ925_19810 [Burkholderia pseudomallei]OND07908.1 hypothetical protein AQ928_00745 [Burkholderia pseudomallei]OND09151.1 hypothetical protein AQ926_01605 [Burkholderia pseudomallei]OND12201.1 hypothetical protein AQ929_07965 [Burkholderia pseudomallei]OND19342.1 hypothetical protein AQ930_18625 [Burkholderia pseudomallei]
MPPAPCRVGNLRRQIASAIRSTLCFPTPMLDEPANHLPATNRTAPPPVGNASLPAPLRALSNRLTGGTPANGAEAPCARSLDGLLGDVRDRSLSATESR